jgi:ribonuclease VapC
MVVIDTSALLAVVFNEDRGAEIARIMDSNRSALRMSTVNLAEVLTLLEDRQPQLFEQLRSEIVYSSIRFVPPSVAHAEIAASARMKFPLNLGDCFAYALAHQDGCEILTLDRDFKKTDLKLALKI